MRAICKIILSLSIVLSMTAAHAVSFEIVDDVIDPGDTGECFEILINPEGQELAGFQYGVQVSGGATVTSTDSQGDWEDWVTLGDPDIVSSVSTAEGSGFTLVVDVDPANVITFGGNSPFPTAFVCIDLPAPASVGQTFTLSFVSNLNGSGINVGYDVGGTLFTNVTQVSGTLRVAAGVQEWNVTGPANVFTAGNWNPAQAPAATDTLRIENNGAATGTGPASLAAENLRVGFTPGDGSLDLSGVDLAVANILDVAGDRNVLITTTESYEGTLTATNADRFQAFDMHVGQSDLGNGANVSTDSTVSITNIDQVIVLEDLEVKVSGFNDNIPKTVIRDLVSDFTVSDAASFVVGEDLEIAKMNNIDELLSASDLSVTVDFLFEDIDEFFIGEDYEIARTNICGADNNAGTMTWDVEGIMRNIGELSLGEDLEFTDGSCDETADIETQLDLLMSNIGFLGVGEDFEIPQFQFNGGGSADLNADVQIINVDDIWIREDFMIGQVDPGDSATGEVDMDIVTHLVNVDTLTIFEGRFHVGVIRPGDQADLSTADIDNVTVVSVSGAEISVDDIVRVGVIGEDGGPVSTNPNGRVDGSLTLIGSSLVTPEVQVGINVPGSAGMAEGTLILNPSFVDTDRFVLGTGGTLVLTVSGDIPATVDNAGAPNTYSRIVADDMLLQGEIIVDIDGMTQEGAFIADLLVAPAGMLDASQATIQVGTVQTGYRIDDLSVTQSGGNDVLRVSFSGAPVAIPVLSAWSLSLLMGLLLVVGVAVIARRSKSAIH